MENKKPKYYKLVLFCFFIIAIVGNGGLIYTAVTGDIISSLILFVFISIGLFSVVGYFVESLYLFEKPTFIITVFIVLTLIWVSDVSTLFFGIATIITLTAGIYQFVKKKIEG